MEGYKSEENLNFLGRVKEEFRYSNGNWPESIKWRERTFLLHNTDGDTAYYDAPQGPHGGHFVVNKEGFVISGRDDRFKDWQVSEEELKE